MKKKGFTIIELIAVILLLGIIAAISASSVINYVNQSREEAFLKMVNNIEYLSKLYISSNKDIIPNINDEGTETFITLQDLVNAGLIKEPIINPIDQSTIDLETEVLIYVLGGNRYHVVLDYGDITP